LENRRNHLKPAPLLAYKPLGYISYAVTPIFNLFFIFFISEYIYKKALFVIPFPKTAYLFVLTREPRIVGKKPKKTPPEAGFNKLQPKQSA